MATKAFIRDYGTFIAVSAPYMIKDKLKSIPSARWDGDLKAWKYHRSPTIGPILKKLFSDLQLDYEGDVEVLDLKQSFPKQQLTYKADPPPWDHQVEIAHKIGQNDAVYVDAAMGVGKTRSVIDAICSYDMMRVLIICPKSVVLVWPKEFQKYSTKDCLVVALDKNTVNKRVNVAIQSLKTQTKPVVLVINYEVVWRTPMSSLLTSVKWDAVVYDEAHRIKSAQGKASAYCFRLRGHTKRAVALSGTPLPHSPVDAFAQYRALDAAILGTSLTRFRLRYCCMGGFEGRQVLGFKNLDELGDKMGSIAIHVDRSAITLPDAVDTVRYVTLSRDEKRAHDGLMKSFKAELKEGQVTAANAAVKLIRMQQCCSGFVKNDDGDIVQVGDSRKMTFRDILYDIRTEPVVIFCKFHRDLDDILDICQNVMGNKPYEISGRKNEHANWEQDDKPSAVVVQIQAGALGISLVRSRLCIFYNLGFSLGDYLQAKARVHRPGQTKNVTHIHLVATDTIDEHIYDALEQKHDVVSHVMGIYR